MKLLRLLTALAILAGSAASLTACKSAHEHPAGEHPHKGEHPQKK